MDAFKKIDEKKIGRKSVFSPISRCLYCNSTSYGSGCKFAPKGIHFHPYSQKKCSYCGSTSFGRGCKLNPFSDLHLHGIDYNMMLSENLHNKLLIKLLNKPFTEFQAYKFGLIDEHGNKVKEPVTESEINALSPDTKTILKVKRYLGSKLDLINQTAILESTNKFSYNKEIHQKVLQYEDKISNIIAQLHEITEQALQDGIPVEQVRAMM
jgi:hypothetical protein